MFPLFETIRIEEGEPKHLEWHQARVDASYHRYFKRAGAPRLAVVIRVPEKDRKGRVKCRFLYKRTAWSTEFSKYVPREVRSLKLVEGNHLEYSMKYTDRFSLDQLFEKRGKCDGVLIVKNGRITDTSFTNIVLFNGEKWITPLYPLLEGTARNRLIKAGRIVEGDIRLEDLQYYRSFRLINAMREFDQQELVPVEQIR